jgi:hypothetical protein
MQLVIAMHPHDQLRIIADSGKQFDAGVSRRPGLSSAKMFCKRGYRLSDEFNLLFNSAALTWWQREKI